MRKGLFSRVVTIILCYLLAVNPVMAQTFKHQEKELEIEKAENTGGQVSYKQKKLEKSKNEFGFGNQLGDFSLNYLLFISHYIPGSLMPVVCRNPMTAALTGGVGGVLPLIWLDNLVFALGSIVSLYTELMIFDHLQSYYRKMEADMKGSGSGSDGEVNLQLKGLELQYEALGHEIELLAMKADAIRATKAAWLLSGALSVSIGVILATAGAAVMATAAVSGGTAGAAAGASIGAALGVEVYGVGAAVGAAYGGVIGAEYGALYSAAAGAAIAEAMHSVTGDVCAPMFGITGAYLGAVGINEAVKKYKDDGEPHPDIKFPPPPKSTYKAPAGASKILPVVTGARSFEELVYGLIEMQTGKSVTLPQYQLIKAELEKNSDFKKGVDEEEFSSLKKYIALALKEDFWKKSSELIQKLSLLGEAHATTVNTQDDQDESAAISDEAVESESLADGFNIFKDATAVFNTGSNVVNLTNDSEIGADFSKVRANPIANAPEVISKYLSWDFFVKFANYLGFSNGGELALLLYVTMVGDLVVLKSRSWIMHPLIPFFYGIDGTWEAKLVSSIVAAYFANAYRKEVIEAKKRAIGFKIRVGEIITAMNKPGGGAATVQGGKFSFTKGASTALSSSLENKECITSSDLIGPQSVGPCPGQQNSKTTAFDLDSEGFRSAFGNISAMAAGTATSLGQALNHMSSGNNSGARGQLRNLGGAGPSLAAAIKGNLDLLSKKFPKKKINDRLSELEKLYTGRIQNALRSAGVKAPALAAAPLSFATLASISAPTETKDNGAGAVKDVNTLKKSGGSAIPDFGGFKMDFAKGKPLATEGGQISAYSKQDYLDATKGNFEYKDDDIGQNAQEDIFKTITLRYFKTAYPRIFKMKE
ncbi:MAG: hypothetical protein A2X86_19070 [Bdellovibrionales bacterium GWA2_49_15]|nr:MAG: hypothetical protein A2X86_19070 [Bdellovibrionales bacterium GWA2_49_15]HAZ14329.1 hypothetical protein [Bdellovibrionales bacterium]